MSRGALLRAALLRDDGAGSVLAVALIGAVATAVLLVTVAGASSAARQRIVGAADAAALAAADAASGAVAGAPCELAASVATANRATLGACVVDGLVATVEVVGRAGPVGAAVRSTAGPPP